MITNFLSITWDVSPTLIQLGSFDIRYYGLTWAFALMIGVWYFTKFVKREGLQESVADSIFWYGALGTILGARLGHCLFYEPDYFLANPLQMLNFRGGGMASHGAACGLLIGLWLFSRKNKLSYIWSLDRIMVPVAVGGAGVRFGNLMNSEIFGGPTTLPWGFNFVRSGEWQQIALPCHPTQIYEALCYILLFVVLIWLYFRKNAGIKYPGLMFGVGLIGVFLSRFFIEYIKLDQVAFESGMVLNMGQWLSVPFVVAAVIIIARALKSKREMVEGVLTDKRS